jgi:hypothetical protein
MNAMITDQTAWARDLDAAAQLSSPEEYEAFAAAVDAVTGEEGDATLEALLAAVRLAHDLGAYEGLHNALWRFPPARLGTFLGARLPAFLRRMNRHQQVLRFLVPLLPGGVGHAAFGPFVEALRALPAADQATVRRAVRDWAREGAELEPLGEALTGASQPKRTAALPPPPEDWPARWKANLAALRADQPVRVWKEGRPDELPQVVALLAEPLGAGWRQADRLTTPLFLSFAKRLWPAFVAAVAALPPAQRERLLAQVGRTSRDRGRTLRDALERPGG